MASVLVRKTRRKAGFFCFGGLDTNFPSENSLDHQSAFGAVVLRENVTWLSSVAEGNVLRQPYELTMPYMYILKCADDSTYVGSTMDLETRLWQHNQGKGAGYTARRLPVTLVYSEEFTEIADAFAREKQIQNWSKAKRAALISGDIAQLKASSKKQFR